MQIRKFDAAGQEPDELAGLIDLFRATPEVDEKRSPSMITAMIRMARLMGRLRRRHAEVAAQFGLLPGDVDILFLLQRAKEPALPRITDLALALRITAGGISKRVDRLESAGMVRRKDSEDDRRAWRICLTDKGMDVARKAREMNGIPPECLTVEQWELLDKLLLTVTIAYGQGQSLAD